MIFNKLLAKMYYLSEIIILLAVKIKRLIESFLSLIRCESFCIQFFTPLTPRKSIRINPN